MNARKRIAINLGGGYVPGLDSVIGGVVRAGHELDWEVIGLRDGYEGLLFPERYPHGGHVPLTVDLLDGLSGNSDALLGTRSNTDPFRVRTVTADQMIEEIDRSDDLLEKLQALGVDGVISVAGGRALSIVYRLSRKGLRTVVVPESVENDVAATLLSFGFNSVLSSATETLERVRHAARSAGRIGVVEVLGEHSGWLALQAGMAVCADAVLIPEIPYDLEKVASALRERQAEGRTYGLVVVAEGALPAKPDPVGNGGGDPLKAMLSPLATEGSSSHVIERSGRVAERVALELQRLTNQETYPLALGQLARGGPSTAVDRQLGLAYGAGAVQALRHGRSGVMVSFQPPDLVFVPLTEAINKVRTVPANSVFLKTAEALGIALGN